jgi:aspartyl-tRNA(Asn)/glutamyl-tRNA(Gln) amidotransferase subunit A
VYATRVPTADATAVRRLRDAGAIHLGKLQTHELAHGGPSWDVPRPPSRNPWALDRFTGGSSSGSAAALAAGMTPLALGSDTGGSIRGPASFCGVTGLMPSTGLVGRGGIIPNSHTFDRCGPMARSAEDCALALQALAGHDPADPASVARDTQCDYTQALGARLDGMRVGLLRHYWVEDVPGHADHRRALDDAVRVLRDLGCVIEECCTPPVQQFVDAKVVIAERELFDSQLPNLRTRPGDYGSDFLGRVLPACTFDAEDRALARDLGRRLAATIARLFESFELLVTAGFGPAPRLATCSTRNFWCKPNLLTPFNWASGPVLAVPIGFGEGLPLGMQIAGRPFDEATVLRAGHAFQRATAWHLSHPALDADARQPVVHSATDDDAPNLSAPERASLLEAAAAAGLSADERATDLLLRYGPHALAMKRRLHAAVAQPA